MKILGVEFHKPTNFSGVTKAIFVFVMMMAAMSFFMSKFQFIGMLVSGIAGAALSSTGICVTNSKRDLFVVVIMTSLAGLLVAYLLA